MVRVYGRVGMLVCAAILVGACSAFGTQQNPESIATEQNVSLAAEGTALRDALNRQAVDIAATDAAAATYIMQRESINAQLLATLRAVIPPTQQIVLDAGAGTPSVNSVPALPGVANPEGAPTPLPGAENAAVTSGGTTFTQIATTSGVNDADGCALGSQTSFTTADAEIYLTARTFNIAAGSILSAAWSVDGSLVYDDFSFTVEADDDDFCVWFSIDPATVPFTPGTWTAQFVMDGVPVEPAAQFTISE